MGRTATAFLMLIAVGGCVADDQGPAAVVLAGQQGQSTHAAPSYATWTHSNDFAADQAAPTAPTPAALTAPPPALPPTTPIPSHLTTTTALKPTAPHKSIIVPGDKPTTAADPAAASTAPMVDPDLVQATMVQTPGAGDAGVKDASFKEMPFKDSTPKDTALKALPSGSHTGAMTADAEPAAAPASTRMVNSKRITLNYELKDVGSTGVGGVELWCTQDTRTWKKGEIVAQTNHSFTVEVKDEGLYGFTLLARNGSGAGKEAPQPGDQPQVWVSVDVTKPVVQITSLELTRGGKAPTLMIHWSAKDKNMGPRPITLAFAEEPEGPWTPIAAGLENNGRYEWQPTGGLPHHVYVRVEAADLHGNVGQALTSNPLRVDSVASSAPLPQSEGTAVRKPLPAPPPLDASRPSAAILAVEPNAN